MTRHPEVWAIGFIALALGAIEAVPRFVLRAAQPSPFPATRMVMRTLPDLEAREASECIREQMHTKLSKVRRLLVERQ